MFIFWAIICGLASMITYALGNVFSQPLAKKYGPAEFLFLRGIVISIILAVITIPGYFKFASVPEILLTFALGMVGYLPVLAFTHGIKISRIGIISPIAGTAPFITILLASLFLGITIHSLQWMAIVVVIGTNIIMSVDLKNWRNSNLLQASSGIPFALLASLGWGCFFFFLVYATNWVGPWMSAFLVEAGVTAAAGIHILLSHKKVHIQTITSKSIIFNSILVCLGTIGYTIGVRYFTVSIVATLSNSTAIVAAIAATYLFHEQLTRKEKLAASAMIVGIIVLTLF